MAWVVVIPVAIRVIGFGGIFFLVAAALGSYVCRWIGYGDRNVSLLEKGLVCAALGCGVLQYLPYSLAQFRMMTPAGVRIASAVLVAALVPRLVVMARSAVAHVRSTLPWRPSGEILVWAVLFVAYLGLLFTRAVFIGPSGDDDGYHLSSPQRWLRDGTLSYLPTYTNTNAAMGFEMLYVLGLADCDPVGAKFLHYAAGVAALVTLALFAKRAGNLPAGLLALSLLAIGTPIVNLAALFPAAYVDLGALWMASMAAVVWLVWRRGRSISSLVAMALLAGFAASFKITAFALALSWIPALVFDRERGAADDWRRTVGRVVTFCTVAFLPVVPWPIRNWRLTGNPVYPLLAGVIKSRDWTPEQARIFGQYMRYHSWGLASGAGLSDAVRAKIVIGTACLIAVLGAIAFTRVGDPNLRWPILSGALFSIASVSSTGIIFRYWLPGMAVALVAGCIALLRDRVPARSVTRVAAALAGLAVVVHVAKTVEGEPPLPHPLLTSTKIALGLSTPEREFADQPMMQTAEFIRTSTPPDARVLAAAFYTSFGASSFGGFRLQRTCFATDSHLQTAIHFDSWRSFLEDIERDGVTHVVITDDQFCRDRLAMSFPAHDKEYPFCRALVDRYGEKIAQFGHVQVYRLSSSALGDAVAAADPAGRSLVRDHAP